jgi:CII-binding regulator of phage lambda lysogenization HflD
MNLKVIGYWLLMLLGIGMCAVLGLTILAFVLSKINKPTEQLTKLQLEKAFLEGKLEQQRQTTDSLTKRSEKLYVEFKQLPTTNTIKVDLDKKYENQVNNIINMPADSTVKFLSEWLSEAASH